MDNIRAIFMRTNVTTISCTKHVDIRAKCIHHYVEAGVVKIIFVKSESNTWDIMTKNIQGDLFDKHALQLVTPKP